MDTGLSRQQSARVERVYFGSADRASHRIDHRDSGQGEQDPINHHCFPECVNPVLGRLLSQFKMDKVYVRGEGCYLYDRDGVRYLDFLAQYGALPFGFNHPKIWRAVEAVRDRLEPSFVQPSYLAAAGELARRLIEVAPAGMQYVTFANSGAEAIEAAIKLCKSSTGREGILSASNGFHGKTLGALSATDNKKYQAKFGAPVAGYAYVPYGDIEALEKALTGGYYAAFLVEPIQGEGGIVEAPAGYLAQASAICRATGTLMVMDEIQTGLGRTGNMFASELEGVRPDVITLAKALGGGLIPIGACLCRKEVYNDDFALKHTSTFAGNALGCRVALAAIDLLEENDRALIRQVAENGARLKQRLYDLQAKYPHIIKTVRGRGYMLGIQFGINRHNYPHSFLGCLGETEVLTALVVSYMLNFERVRLGYTLNQDGVLRIEPPLIATWGDCTFFLEAFENTITKLDRRNTALFTAHITGRNIDTDDTVGQTPVKQRRLRAAADDGRFAFILHPLTESNYAELDASLSVLSDQQLRRLGRCMADNFDPFVIGEARIISDCGKSAYGEFIIVPRTAEELVCMSSSDALPEIDKACKLAQERGAKIIGLGAYTSIVTRGGLYLANTGLPALTTGNSYTAITSKQCIEATLQQQGRELSQSIVAILGASGSIGRAVSILLAEDAKALVLIGNPAHPITSRRRLLEVAADILQRLWQLRLQGCEFREGSLARHISPLLPPSEVKIPKPGWARLAEGIIAGTGVIRTTCDIQSGVREADVVVTATSAVNEILREHHLKRRAIVCDISRPSNVYRSLSHTQTNAVVFDGGVVRLPHGSMLSFNFDLQPGLVYACMAETMLLALDHQYQDTSLGIDVNMDQALQLGRLAHRHGFRIALD